MSWKELLIILTVSLLFGLAFAAAVSEAVRSNGLNSLSPGDPVRFVNE